MSYPSVQPTVPPAPANPDVCRLYGKLADLTGAPVAYRTILIWSWPILDQAVISGNAQLLNEPIRCVSRRDGSFYVDVFRSAPIEVLLPDTRRTYRMTVPDLEVAPLFDHLVPYPTKVLWCEVDPLDENSHTPILDGFGEPTTTFTGAVGDTAYFGLCVEYSNGMVCRKKNIAFTSTSTMSASEVEPEGEHAVRVTSLGVDTVTLISLELENTSANQSFWERVGFENPLPPQYLPPQAYELADAEDLTIHFL